MGLKELGQVVLKCSDAEFEERIKTLDMRTLLHCVSLLQKEMTQEQSNFNSISAQMDSAKPGSSKQRRYSQDLVRCQQRLDTLMERNKRCFEQQAVAQQRRKEQQLKERRDLKLKSPLLASRAISTPNLAQIGQDDLTSSHLRLKTMQSKYNKSEEDVLLNLGKEAEKTPSPAPVSSRRESRNTPVFPRKIRRISSLSVPKSESSSAVEMAARLKMDLDQISQTRSKASNKDMPAIKPPLKPSRVAVVENQDDFDGMYINGDDGLSPVVLPPAPKNSPAVGRRNLRDRSASNLEQRTTSFSTDRSRDNDYERKYSPQKPTDALRKGEKVERSNSHASPSRISLNRFSNSLQDVSSLVTTTSPFEKLEQKERKPRRPILRQLSLKRDKDKKKTESTEALDHEPQSPASPKVQPSPMKASLSTGNIAAAPLSPLTNSTDTNGDSSFGFSPSDISNRSRSQTREHKLVIEKPPKPNGYGKGSPSLGSLSRSVPNVSILDNIPRSTSFREERRTIRLQKHFSKENISEASSNDTPYLDEIRSKLQAEAKTKSTGNLTSPPEVPKTNRPSRPVVRRVSLGRSDKRKASLSASRERLDSGVSEGSILSASPSSASPPSDDVVTKKATGDSTPRTVSSSTGGRTKPDPDQGKSLKELIDSTSPASDYSSVFSPEKSDKMYSVSAMNGSSHTKQPSGKVKSERVESPPRSTNGNGTPNKPSMNGNRSPQQETEQEDDSVPAGIVSKRARELFERAGSSQDVSFKPGKTSKPNKSYHQSDRSRSVEPRRTTTTSMTLQNDITRRQHSVERPEMPQPHNQPPAKTYIKQQQKPSASYVRSSSAPRPPPLASDLITTPSSSFRPSGASVSRHMSLSLNDEIQKGVSLTSVRRNQSVRDEVQECGVPGNTLRNQAAAVGSASRSVEDMRSKAMALSSPDGAVKSAVSQFDVSDDQVQPRKTMKHWDPTPLLNELYNAKLEEEEAGQGAGGQVVNKEGYLEKLPMGKRKATLLKTWRKRYFRVANGTLTYYDNATTGKVGAQVQLMGGTVEDLGGRMLGIDDGRGHYLMVRAPNPAEFEAWKNALESNSVQNSKFLFVEPVQKSTPHKTKKVLIVDIGTTAVRAGLLGEEASLPELYFPSVVAINQSGKHLHGFEALKPEVRNSHVLRYPIGPTIKIDRGAQAGFTLDMEYVPSLFNKIFTELNIKPQDYSVLVVSPQTMATSTREKLVNLLLNELKLKGVCVVNQALLALHSYKATSGILIDIGERAEIVPVTDGFMIEGAVRRLPLGGRRIADKLNTMMTEYRLFTDIESYIVRHVMEQSCYVSSNYTEDVARCLQDPQPYATTIDLSRFDLPDDCKRQISVDLGRFKSSEGMFDPELWGMDNAGLHKLIHGCIQQCPMDIRREMFRNIYLSGGATKLPGFVERLQAELEKLVPPSIVCQVNASPNRHHAAYIGACTVAALDHFPTWCVTQEEWAKLGPKACNKWH